ncbi:MAG: hypothetical protein AAF827_00955 [Cyanobacteria bacterium P01_D01_bin.6]
MNQLELKSEELNDCPWARPSSAGEGVVLALPQPLTPGLAPWLRSRGWRLREYAKDRGQAAAWMVGGNTKELLMWLPPPPSQGSRTPGNYLPF